MESEVVEKMDRVRAPRPDHVPPDRVRDIDMYALKGIDEGFHEAWKRVQQPGVPAMIWTPFTGGHWIATNGETVREIYADPERFSSAVIFLPKEAGEKYEMVKGLNPSQMRKVEDKVRAVAAELIEDLAGRGECDYSAEYAKVFPVRVFMALADLPMDDVPRLNQFASQMTRPDGETPEEMAASLDAANRGFFEYVDPIIRARTGGSGDDIITLMVNTEINGQPITHDKALGLISLLLLAGLDTVVNFLSFIMIYLARHPEVVAELRSDPLKLMRSAEEMFRRFPVVSDARMVAKDLSFKGVQLKRGDMILLPTALHGLDESLNPDPWKLDLDRRGMSHSTFGGGPHRCAGMHLARMETIISLEEWLKRIPEFSLRADAKPTYFSGIVAAVENVPLIWPVKS
jgi:cytochrome P450